MRRAMEKVAAARLSSLGKQMNSHGEKGENEYEKESENLAQMTIAHDQIPPSDIDTRTDNDIIKNDSHRISIHKRIQRNLKEPHNNHDHGLLKA